MMLGDVAVPLPGPDRGLYCDRRPCGGVQNCCFLLGSGLSLLDAPEVIVVAGRKSDQTLTESGRLPPTALMDSSGFQKST